MRLHWMMSLLLLLLLRVEANQQMEVRVVLGQQVTLTCSEKNTCDLYWYVQIYGNLSAFIGRTFSNQQQHNYCSPPDRTKFLLQENRLNISTVTAGDCRLYYCAKKDNNTIQVLHTFHLVSDVPPPPPTSGLDSDRQEVQRSGSLLHSVPVLYASLALNGLFILVTTGVAFVSLCSKKKSTDFQVDEPPPVTYETPQYEEIHFTSSVRPAAAAECIYYKAQLPRPHADTPAHLVGT